MTAKPARLRERETSDEDEEEEEHDDQSLADMLQELRVLLQGTQVLTAFLIILPFNQGFGQIDEAEKWVYLATFVSSLTALVFFTAPAAQHRLARPIVHRERFKNFATRMMVIGLVPLSVSLVLSSQLVVSQVFGVAPSLVVAGIVLVLIAVVWWVLPLARKEEM
jgi:accessory gene regulator protein AgrB